MAYTAVPSRSTGDPAYTAEFLNTYIKNNFAAGIPDLMVAKRDIIAATGAKVASPILGGANQGFILQILSSATTGLIWRTQPAADKITAKGQMLVGTAANTLAAIAAGSKGATLTSDSGEGGGIKFADGPGLSGIVTTKGDLIAGTAADTAARLAVGGNGARLIADSSQTAGMAWVLQNKVHAYDDNNLNVSAGQYEEVDYDSEKFDLASAYNVSTNVYTVDRTGYYLISTNGVVFYDSVNVSEYFEVAVIDISTSAILTTLGSMGSMASGDYALVSGGADILYLTSGQTIRFVKYASQTINSGDNDTNMSIYRIGI